MRFSYLGWGMAAVLCCATLLQAAPKRENLVVSPPEVKLDSHRAYRQFVVTGYDHDNPYDVTHSATYRVADSRVAIVHDGRVLPVGNGKTTIQITAEGKTLQVPVVVSNFTKSDPVRFKFETLATLTKQGCATGSCHGSPHGKGGFSLSLFGYDPMIDRISLTHDGFNRRVNVLEPTESLMLKKPLLEIPHVGGKRLRKTDASYQILKQWIYDGANVDLPAVECSQIVLSPNTSRVLHRPNLNQQLSVLAYYSDGTVRDVTAIATYETSHPDIATVNADGLVAGHSRGQAAISVRYLDKLQSIHFTIVEDVPGFVWTKTPESNVVDRLVNAKLKQLQYLPSGICTDAEFLRRISLDLTGLLPLPETTRAFLKDTSPDKRTRLVNKLLDSEEYARFQSLKLADLMRITPGRLNDGRAEHFANWITDSIRQNRPYDALAREILTAQGDTQEIPTANYFLAIPTMEERTEMTSQIFMGTRVECAKCHNHPFENWTQRDYYKIAAVFARVTADRGEVKLASTGESLLPTTKEAMAPWGKEKTDRSNGDRRIAFAQWLTKPENPYFARVAVNRMWADLMGRGIVEPIDDFRSSNPPANEELLNTLAAEFIRTGYDRKYILRLICNSQTYQRSTQTNRFNTSDTTLFSHAKPRLLTAEQLKDAIGLATRTLEPTSEMAPKLTEIQNQIATRITKIDVNYSEWLAKKEKEATTKVKTKDELAKDAENLAGLLGIPTADRSEKQKTELRALLLGELLATPSGQRTDRQKTMVHELFLAEDTEYVGLTQKRDALYNRMDYATQRPYPEASRFTTTFGQPSRQTACTCERQNAPTLLQALELLNGNTASQMAQKALPHYATFEDTKLVEELYLSALCRFPTTKETATAVAYLKASPDHDNKRMDLVWTLINTQEFLFQH